MEVKKSNHYAWQIHYHIVFPVKYRKALLDEEVERIIVETARGIEERFDIEFEQNKFASLALRLSPQQDCGVLRRRKTKPASYA